MAYETIISCDLCDVVAMFESGALHEVKASVKTSNGDNERELSNKRGHRGALLCVRCVAPITAIIDALEARQTRADKTEAEVKLTERVREMLVREK
jgi:hypothetical protein